MPLPTRNLAALITTVGGVHPAAVRIIVVYVNSIATLQVRSTVAARQGEWWWETRARRFVRSVPNKAKDGRLVSGGCPPLVSCLPTRISVGAIRERALYISTWCVGEAELRIFFA